MDEKSVARFWAKVDKSGGPDACWMWTASTGTTGYGQFAMPGARVVRPHRVSWELANGPISKTGGHVLFVCHRCDVPLCCNPSHLFLGTCADNAADMAAKGRARGKVSPGEVNGNAKLTEADVIAIRAERASGLSYPKIGAKYGISAVQASNIAKGKQWVHLPRT